MSVYKHYMDSLTMTMFILLSINIYIYKYKYPSLALNELNHKSRKPGEKFKDTIFKS